MEALGWRTLSYQGQELAFRVEKSSTDITVVVTDLTRVWCDRQSIEEVADKSKKFNPLLEATSEKLVSHLYLLLSQSSTELELERKDDALSLKLKSKLDNLPFSWEFDLSVESPEKLQKYVIRPLLAMLKEDSNIQEELCTIIRSKDKEIDDYKASGAAVSRKQLLTQEFNKERYFKERRWRSLEESAKHNPVQMFCLTATESSGLYNEAVKRVVENDERKSAKALDVPDNEEATESSSNLVATSEGSKNKEAKEIEASRREAVRKRLQEEERKTLEKLKQKKKPKF